MGSFNFQAYLTSALISGKSEDALTAGRRMLKAGATKEGLTATVSGPPPPGGALGYFLTRFDDCCSIYLKFG